MHKILSTLTLVSSLFLTGPILSADTFAVDIIKFRFSPAEITIKPGDTVRWVNKEKRQYHSVWFEALGEPEADYLFPGDSYQRTFKKTGTFPYRCGPHPKMTGIVNVRN